MERNTMEGKTFHIGELEFTYFIKGFIRAYQYRNKNENPESVVFPTMFEVDGVKVIFPLEPTTKPVQVIKEVKHEGR